MREYETKERVIHETKIVNVKCNKCKKESSKEMWGEVLFQQFGCSFGYGSRYDMESWSFDLCEDCLTDIVRTFALVPDGWSADRYNPYYPQVTFDKWKETGEIDIEAGMTPEQIEEQGGSIYANCEDDEEE